MSNKGKAILSLLVSFIILPSLAFAQEEDIFVDTWQGRLSGESYEITPSEDFERKFEMDIANLKVAPEAYLPFSGWARVHYPTPKWIPKEEMPIHRSAEVKTAIVTGQIRGAIHLEEKTWLSLFYDNLIPVITYTTIIGNLPPSIDTHTRDILGYMFDVIYSYPKLELTVIVMEDDSIKLNFEDENIFSDKTGSAGCKVKVNGVLYKVDIERDTLGDTIKLNELIKTDEHTRKEIIIPNVGEVIVNTDSECKFKTDRLLEQFKGRLFYKIRKLEPLQFEIRTPVAVIGPRGTQFLTKVEKDGTTTLTVLEGTVEFSDLNKKKTVVVKKIRHQ